MKRTIEIVLTAIGLLFSLLGAGLTTFLVLMTRLDVFKEGFEEGYYDGAIEGTYDNSEAAIVLNILSGFGWLVVSMFAIGIILGIISIFFYIGNKKPKAASIILIIGSVIVGIGTVLTGFMPALLYLIAGIIGLVRKPPVEHTDPIASTTEL